MKITNSSISFGKLLFVIPFFAMFLFGGCMSNREALVNARPEFVADDVWTLVEIRGKAVTLVSGESPVTLQVNPEAGTVGGCSGCNRFMGKFKDLGDGKMELTEVFGTRMACPEAIAKKEAAFMQLFRRCNGYQLDGYSLTLKQGENALLRFEKE